MQVKLLLILLLITLLAIAIISGCGGGIGTTQPASLVTPTPNMTDNMAYITIKVKWPEQGMAGKLIMSSEDGKEITASMPPDAEKIELKIFNYKDKNANEPIDLGDIDNILSVGQLPKPDTQITLPIPVPAQVSTEPNILPAIPVKVWAGCYSYADETDPAYALSIAEHYMILRVGNQTANLNLGNYELKVFAEKITSIPSPASKIITNIGPLPTATPTYGTPDTPTPATGGSGTYQITAKLMIVYPSPEPGATALAVPTSKPADFKWINFEVVDENATLSPTGGHTESDGCCTTTLTTSTSEPIKVRAYFIPDHTSDIIYEDTCTINSDVNGGGTATPTVAPTLSPTPQDLEQYRFVFENYGQELFVIPGFENNCVNSQVIYSATLKKRAPDTGFYPAVGETINYSIIDGIGNIISSTDTDSNGVSTVTIKTDVNYPAPRTIKVKAEYRNVNNDPNHTYSAINYIYVRNGVILKDNFENYPDGNFLNTYPNYWESLFANLSLDFDGLNHSVNIKTANVTAAALRGTKGTFNTCSCELRAKVKIHEDGLGSIYLLQGNSMQHLIQYRDREILDLNGDVIGNYTPLEWVSIKFRFKYNYSDNTVIDYWINDEYVCSSNRVIISSPNIYQGFICFMCGMPSSGAVGQVWYDDLELYNFSWPGFIWPLTE